MTLEVQLALCSTVRKLSAYRHNPRLPLKVPFHVESPFTEEPQKSQPQHICCKWYQTLAPSNARAVDESVSYLAFLARLLNAYACTACPLLLKPGTHKLDRLKQLGGWWPSLSFHKNGPM